MSSQPASIDSPVESVTPASESRPATQPRLGFLGVGWIGRDRLKAIADGEAGQVVAIADPEPEMRRAAGSIAPQAELLCSLDDLLQLPLDGIVIASPSALHAEQSIAALEQGVAVFCQKPLGRTEAETRAVVDLAKRFDLMLGVDLSYRFTEAFATLKRIVGSGEIGQVYAADLVFHNAFGPDKAWFYDRGLAGGGCVMDLGIHLVDLALWMMNFPAVEKVSSHLYSGGCLLAPSDDIEDFAVATLELEGGATVRISCSWNLPAGQDAVISATFYGTSGGAAVRNIGGSFYDFVAERYVGTQRQVLVEPPDRWGGRAAVEWARRLGAGERYDPATEEFAEVARVLDLIYRR